MNLHHIADNILRLDSKRAAFREKEATTYLLHHIKEVDRRKLYCDWKFTSLFDWCVKDLGLCEGSAHLRITAARMMADMPEIEQKIEQGVLNLTNISQVNQFCRENDIKDKASILIQVENLTKFETEKKLIKISGKDKPARESRKKISDKNNRVTYVLSDETMESIAEVKSLIGKNISTDELMKLMVNALKEKVEKEKFKQVEKPRQSKGTKVAGRVITAEVKREVYARDKKCVNCGSKHRLNFDHRKPHSHGGDNSVKNIRLLCFQCNHRAWKTSSG
ncbi:MAG TPA: HNH endonuclease signature motif containing protein [Bacteriovoracaceae bacterium]|nr:HNH endonuclease signature motif containing protein [Bacteriovoracaceae bacterium]